MPFNLISFIYVNSSTRLDIKITNFVNYNNNNITNALTIRISALVEQHHEVPRTLPTKPLPKQQYIPFL